MQAQPRLSVTAARPEESRLSTVALCMIVKNAAETIRPCLESVAGVVDQIVIADTGCTDNTCDIAREFGATLVSFPWQDHFAKARNAAIAAATTDWILVLDGDEELGAEARHTLPALLAEPSVGGYLVPIWEYVPFATGSGSAWTATILPNDSDQERASGAPSYLINTLCRLFRRREDVYFTGRVHEMVLPQVEATGLAVLPAPFCIHHYGHLAAADAIARKRIFYNDLLHKRLADDASDLTTLTMCGLDEWEVHRRPLEALRYFQQALQVNPNAFETWLLTAKVLCAVHRYEEALAALDVVEHVSKDAHLQYTLRGDALYALGRLADARVAYSTALRSSPNDRLLQSKRDYIDIDGLGLGDRDAAVDRLRLAAADLPSAVEIHEFFVNACIRSGRIAEAADEAERFSKLDRREAFLIRAARLRAQLQQWARARAMAEECAALYPASPDARELLMMALVALGHLSEAAAEAELLTSLVNEPRAFLRAAGIHAQMHNHERMRQCLERGLQRFPASAQLRSALASVSPPAPPAPPGPSSDRMSEKPQQTYLQ